MPPFLRVTLPILWLAALLARPPSAPAQEGGARKVRDTLARLEKGEPGGNERMRALVSLAKAGRAAVPALVETLEKGSPPNRAFAAWVLGVLADPAARPALEKALGDPEQEVRSQAVLALRMLGPLKLTDRQRRLLEKSNFHVRAHLEFALDRDDDPNPAALRKALADYDPARIGTARVGQPAPDFALADLAGKAHRLGRIREGKGAGGPKPVVLMFLMMDH
jgi:HEAT repeat protein